MMYVMLLYLFLIFILLGLLLEAQSPSIIKFFRPQDHLKNATDWFNPSVSVSSLDVALLFEGEQSSLINMILFRE